MNKAIKRLIEKVESLGWTVTDEGDNQYLFSKFSPAGQDFNTYVEGENAEEIIANLYERYENYDVSEETYLWLDDTGHGTNGAPYEMEDLLNDMKACEQMMLDLYEELSEVEF